MEAEASLKYKLNALKDRVTAHKLSDALKQCRNRLSRTYGKISGVGHYGIPAGEYWKGIFSGAFGQEALDMYVERMGRIAA